MTDDRREPATTAAAIWEAYLTGRHDHLGRQVRIVRSVFGRLPARGRCRVCRAPFDGISGRLAAVMGFGAGRSGLNPTRCDRCEKLVKDEGVGVELEITMLFADVRGSTTLAEQMEPSEFHRIIDRFYRIGIEVFIRSNALIEKLIGDEIAALYVPGIAGPDHAAVGLGAARDLLGAVGYGSPAGPLLPIGIGLHTGTVYAGAVGGAGRMSVITVLGDAANITARLAATAAPGEILISDETYRRAGLDIPSEMREIEVRGRQHALVVRSVRPAGGSPSGESGRPASP